jgi:hypothetical protein
MASVAWVKDVLCNLLWPVASKRALHVRLGDETEMVVGQWQCGEGDGYASKACIENCI